MMLRVPRLLFGPHFIVPHQTTLTLPSTKYSGGKYFKFTAAGCIRALMDGNDRHTSPKTVDESRYTWLFTTYQFAIYSITDRYEVEKQYGV